MYIYICIERERERERSSCSCARAASKCCLCLCSCLFVVLRTTMSQIILLLLITVIRIIKVITNISYTRSCGNMLSRQIQTNKQTEMSRDLLLADGAPRVFLIIV